MIQNFKDLKDVINASGAVYIIDSEVKFKEWYEKEKEKEYHIYRGLNDASYKMYTSAQVQYDKKRLTSKYSYESFLEKIDTFSKSNLSETNCKYNPNGNVIRYNNILNIPISFEDNSLFRFFYLQHIGIPTHLIDFSTNLDVALFFAVDNATKQTGNSLQDWFQNIMKFLAKYPPFKFFGFCNCRNTKKKFVLSDYIQIISIDTIQNQSILRNIGSEIGNYNGPYTHWGILQHYKHTTKFSNNINNGKYVSTTLQTNTISVIPALSLDMDFSNKNNIVQEGWLVWNNTPNEPLEEILKNGDVKTNRILISKSLLPFLENKHLSEFFTNKYFNFKGVKENMYPLIDEDKKNEFYATL